MLVTDHQNPQQYKPASNAVTERPAPGRMQHFAAVLSIGIRMMVVRFMSATGHPLRRMKQGHGVARSDQRPPTFEGASFRNFHVSRYISVPLHHSASRRMLEVGSARNYFA